MTRLLQPASDRPTPTVPLDAFTDLATMSLTDTDSHAALDKVVRVTRDSVRGAADVSITMLHDGTPTTAAWADQLSYDLDQSQYGHNSGPCLDAPRGGEIQRIDDMRTETRWPAFAADAADRGVLSSLSLPLPAQGSVTGALNIYANPPGAFDAESIAVATALAAYGAVSLFNLRVFSSAVREAESIKQAMSSRAQIEQAKGILMCRHACSAESAFEMLVRQSQARNIKLRTVAQVIVASIQPADGHQRPGPTSPRSAPA
jgi:GAF domain-containing protein